MSNPYAPGSPGTPMGGGVPPELAKKAGNIYTMGIASIPLAVCCGIVGIILSIIVLVQAGGVTAELQRYGSPPDLMGKVSTGKTCAMVGLGVFAVAFVGGILLQVMMAVANN